jgi:hypothetical protein
MGNMAQDLWIRVTPKLMREYLDKLGYRTDDCRRLRAAHASLSDAPGWAALRVPNYGGGAHSGMKPNGQTVKASASPPRIAAAQLRIHQLAPQRHPRAKINLQ